MMRYLALPMLEEKNISAFDAWAQNYIKGVDSIELSPSGQGFESVIRLKLTNLNTLINLYRQIADIKMPEDLPNLKRPELKGGKRTVVEIETPKAYENFLNTVQERARAIHAGLDPSIDNFLKITSDLKKASLDMRLVDPSISESEAAAKINAICDTVATTYKETANVKGTQLIFSDLSVPKGKNEEKENETEDEDTTSADDIVIYEQIKKGLIKRGIPANQIAFVHDAKNNKERQKLFEKVNEGEIRVIIGSTSKMGAGTNFQKHLVALHHLDCPWRPRDVEQREGRILRSGNLNKEVEIFTYVTKGSFDANMWEKVTLKKEMMDAFLRGDLNIKEIDDFNSEDTLGYEDIMSHGLVDQSTRETARLNSKLRALQYEKNTFTASRQQKAALLRTVSKSIPQEEQRVNELKADIAEKVSTKGDAFKMKLGDTVYTKRADAAAALEKMIARFKNTTPTKVGEIGGFDIIMRASPTYAERNGVVQVVSTNTFVRLANHGSYSMEHSLKSIEHFISQGGIEKELTFAEQTLKNSQERQATLQEELAAPFPKQAEIDDIQSQLNDLHAQLDPSKGKKIEVGTSDDISLQEETKPPSEKSSIQGTPNTQTDNAVDDKDLTPLQKLLKSFSGKLGVKLVFFDNADGRFHGVSKEGKIFINVNSKKPIGKVFWHESFHWLKNNNPKLYDKLVKAAGITDAQRKAYLKETERTDLKTDDEIDEEILCDMMEDTAKRTGLLQSIAGKNRGLIERVIQWLKDTMNKFIDHFRNPSGKLTTKQAQALADEFGRIAKDLVDPNGDKIFRYNRRTHNIELADGRNLSETTLDEMTRKGERHPAKYSFAGVKAKTADFKQLAKAQRMKSEGATAEDIFYATGWIKGKDGKLRFEIPDNLDKITFDKLKGNKTVTLGDIYDNEQLFKAYPFLRDIKVSKKSLGKELGVYTKNKFRIYNLFNPYGKIELDSKALVSDAEMAKETLIHEIQHAIQEYEDFARGGTPKIAKAKLKKAGEDPDVFTDYEAWARLGGEQEAEEARLRAKANTQLIRKQQKAVEEYNSALSRFGRMYYNQPSHIQKRLDKWIEAVNNRDDELADNLTDNLPDDVLEAIEELNSTELRSGRGYMLSAPIIHEEDALIIFNDGVFPALRMDNSPHHGLAQQIKNWFKGITDKYAGKSGIDERIITTEQQKKMQEQAQKQAMAEYLKNPSRGNMNRLKYFGVTKGQLEAYMNGEEYLSGISLIQNYRSSPSRIADKVAVFRAFFRMGDRAMDKIVKLRDRFNNHYAKAMNFLKDEKDRAQFAELLWDGDEMQQEFGTLTEAELERIKADNPTNTTQAIQRAKIEKICKEQEVSENVAKAYLEIRRQMNRAYTLVDEAQRHLQPCAKHLSKSDLAELRKNKFARDIKVHETKDEIGRHLVTWREFENVKKAYRVNEKALEKFRADDAIQILSEKQLPDGSYELEVREGIPALERFGGYIPHYFHQYHVTVKNAQGKQIGDIIGTGRTQREAIKVAEEWKKNHTLKDGENIYITPRIPEFGMNERYTPTIGDEDYQIMMNRIVKNTGLTLEEAKKIVNGAVKVKNRHRFFGQLLQRKGYKGYETDMDWVLRHHFNTVARYVALETEFKPKAISLFERVFGDFNGDHSKNLLAQYTKDYINDVNGTPAWIDEVVNQTLNQNGVWRKYFLPNLGEQALQNLSSSITGRVSYLTLGMCNISSALLNYTQLVNASGYVGWAPVLKHFGEILSRGGKLNQSELRILSGSGVLSDIGLDTASSYDKNRGYVSSLPGLKQLDWLGNKSMIPFQVCDSLCRVSTALAAYEKALAEGKTKTQALEYAKKINRQANFSYGVEDAPNIFRRTSSFGKISLQFMKYSFKQLEVIADFLPQSKKTNFKQKAAFWIPYLLICGLGGIPALDWLDEIFNEKLGLFPKDFLQKLCIQGSREIFGDNEAGRTIGKIAMYGAPALLNVDVSKRAGLANMVPQDMYGAAISKVFGAGTNMVKGDYANALRSVSPGLFNIYAATVAGETKGARGRKVSIYEDVWGRIIRGIGFNSVDESLATDIQRINYNERDEKVKEDQRAIDAYIEDPSPENLKLLKELKIKPDRVKEERKKKQLDRKGRLEQNMTKAERKRNQYLLDFAK